MAAAAAAVVEKNKNEKVRELIKNCFSVNCFEYFFFSFVTFCHRVVSKSVLIPHTQTLGFVFCKDFMYK